MDLNQLTQQAVKIKELYREENAQKGLKPWRSSDYMLGFAGDVGDLAKLVMAHNGLRHKDNIQENLSHELADCLWSLLVLADELNINLEDAFVHTMKELEARFETCT